MSPDEAAVLWESAMGASDDGDKALALTLFKSIDSHSFGLQLNVALCCFRMEDNAQTIAVLSHALSSLKGGSPKADRSLIVLGKWIRGIAHANWGEETLALEDFRAAKEVDRLAVAFTLLTGVQLMEPREFLEYSDLGFDYTLYQYEIRFNWALCLWRMGLIDDSAQELADARPFAVTDAHVEAFEEVMQSGFDPPGLFSIPDGPLFPVDEVLADTSTNTPPTPPDSPPMNGPAHFREETSVDTPGAGLPSSLKPSRKPTDPPKLLADIQLKSVNLDEVDNYSYHFRPRDSNVPPVPTIPAHLLAKSKKEVPGNASPSLLHLDPLSSSAAEGAARTKSQEEIEKELAEALAAAEAYRDSCLGEKQDQFLAYADYLVALEEVLEKDVKVSKHQSFYTVCSDTDDEDEDDADATLVLSPSSQKPSSDSLPRKDSLARVVNDPRGFRYLSYSGSDATDLPSVTDEGEERDDILTSFFEAMGSTGGAAGTLRTDKPEDLEMEGDAESLISASDVRATAYTARSIDSFYEEKIAARFSLASFSDAGSLNSGMIWAAASPGASSPAGVGTGAPDIQLARIDSSAPLAAPGSKAGESKYVSLVTYSGISDFLTASR
ncbi:hypothetical protein HK101_005032 [Irineochytrium annulatum]|nr:hypothetical protein HK101_005032 [Irineochytrium annulatum]